MRVRLGPVARSTNDTGICRQTRNPAWRPNTAHLSYISLIPLVLALFGVAFVPSATAQIRSAQATRTDRNSKTPPRVAQARRFLAQRGWMPGHRAPTMAPSRAVQPRPQVAPSASSAPWQPLGPAAVLSPNYGLVTGRVSALALDPSDATGNQLYVGTTGGGLWFSQDAGTSLASNVVFTPLTDTVAALSGQEAASISVGAVTVQPGGTGVILVGTGDPNDALDSYYGAGVLRSADGGNSWSLIQGSSDLQDGLALRDYYFIGEGFAGFAWSTSSPQLVVAAVSQAYEGTLVDASLENLSYEGLYYSSDAGVTWHLARITDINGEDVQGPLDALTPPDGNAATSVVWNSQRGLFIAAVRFHGYYQSADGVTWTRLAAQPGSSLTTAMCPTNSFSLGSTACPLYRGTVAVNPLTGDTFAWTVDLNNQDQGLWQDSCSLSGTTCGNPTITFNKQWSTAALETNTTQGSVTIENGDYNLALAAVPSNQDTILLAGANDLWKCSLAMSCAWRNTTNASTCMSSQVASFQHALAYNLDNPLEVFVGNDSGLWRSTDAIAETGPVCSASDASHFQNLNAGLGSLAEVVSISPVNTSPYAMMAGLGVNGTAGSDSTSGPTSDWPQILGGDGGPVAVDPNNAANWYVNNGAGVSIHECTQAPACTSADFGVSPVVTNADVNGDGLTMTTAAPFLVDPADSTKLLIGTCRVWRGPANGVGWTTANAISPVFGGAAAANGCNGNSLIRSLAALPLSGGGEVVYAGMFGAADGGDSLPGHIFGATLSASGTWSAWKDLTLNPVTNGDSLPLNLYGLDISSLFVDPHDPSGNTVYATVAGFPSATQEIAVAYSSTDGGAHWTIISANLPQAPANSLVIDPQDASTAYIATDVGVYSTRQIATCGVAASNCWAAFGSELPEAPIVQLSAAAPASSLNVLIAATYGRGLWQIPLLTAGTQLTTASVQPTALTFSSVAAGTASSPQVVTLENTGGLALTPTTITVNADYSETDNCAGATINGGASCTIEVLFTPIQTGARTGQLTIAANVSGGQITVPLSGTGTPSALVTLAPATVSFGQVEMGTTSPALQVTAENAGGTLSISSVAASPPFVLASNACGTTSLAGNTDCQLTVEFAPTIAGITNGTLTMVDGAGTQTVQLSGIGAKPPTDTLAPTSLAFPATIEGQPSSALTVSLTNSGDIPLTSIAWSATDQLAKNQFQLSSNCTTQLTGQSSCSINVTFVPAAIGPQTGTLTVSDILKNQTIPLSGIGLLPPAFVFSPTSISFPGQPVGVASAPQTLSVTNGGGAPMSNVGFAISGASAADFSIGNNTCGATLANGANCTVQITFTPVASGVAQAALTTTSSTRGVSPGQIVLTGDGQSPGLTATPAQLTFTPLPIGQTSAPQSISIGNTGSQSANGLSLIATGPFTLTQNTCGSTLAVGSNCSVQVVFAPQINGSLTGALTISSSTVTAATVPLSGTGGLTGMLNFQPVSLIFPTTGMGTSSAAQTVTITNTSSSLTLPSFALAVTPGFKLQTTTCGTTLGPDASCTAAIVFSPASPGAQTSTLIVSSSILAANATVALSGLGYDFTVAVSGSSSPTVASGQAASYTLNFTPLDGASGSFSFLCGTLPTDASCTFNPTVATVAAGMTGTVTLNVATAQATTASQRRPDFARYALIPLACGLIAFPLAWRRRSKALFLIGLLGFALSCVTACSSSGGGGSGGGGGGGGSGGGGSTVAGTYPITVTVTSNGVQHSVALTLVID